VAEEKIRDTFKAKGSTTAEYLDAADRLYTVLEHLYINLVESENDRNADTGEEYADCVAARNALDEFGYLFGAEEEQEPPAETMKKVYFIREELGNVKIGFSNDPAKRRDELQTGNSKFLILLGWFDGTPQDETELKKKFQHLRDANGTGTEWFKPEPELLGEIDNLITHYPIEY